MSADREDKEARIAHQVEHHRPYAEAIEVCRMNLRAVKHRGDLNQSVPVDALEKALDAIGTLEDLVSVLTDGAASSGRRWSARSSRCRRPCSAGGRVMAACANCGATDCPCALLRPDQNCERRRAERAERERDAALQRATEAERVILEGRTRWPMTLAALEEALSTFPAGRDFLRRWTAADARADALAEALERIAGGCNSAYGVARDALAAHRRGA